MNTILNDLDNDVSAALKSTVREFEKDFEGDAKELFGHVREFLTDMEEQLEAGLPLEGVLAAKDTEATLLYSASLSNRGEKEARAASAIKALLNSVVWVALKAIVLKGV